MKKKNIFLILGGIVLIIVVVALFFVFKPTQDPVDKFAELRENYPELNTVIDDIVKAEAKLEEDENRVESYATLGIAWKTLAEEMKNRNTKDYKDYFQKTLEVYKKAIEITNRQNTLFLMNAGNIEELLGNYEATEEYYKESISLAPGLDIYYVNLAELYEYKMNKTKEEIVAVFEDGEARVMNPDFLKKRKESFLERWDRR